MKQSLNNPRKQRYIDFLSKKRNEKGSIFWFLMQVIFVFGMQYIVNRFNRPKARNSGSNQFVPKSQACEDERRELNRESLESGSEIMLNRRSIQLAGNDHLHQIHSTVAIESLRKENTIVGVKELIGVEQVWLFFEFN